MNPAVVLIAEDLPANQVLLATLCRRMGLQTDLSANGQEALALARNRAYDAYIVDLLMPVMSGVDFLRELKILRPDALVLVQTALDRSETVIEVMRLGVFDYLIKPLDEEQFRAVMSKTLEFRRLRLLEQSRDPDRKLRGQLEWLSYKETRRRISGESLDKYALDNLRTSFSQGAGVGASITLIDFLESSARPDGATVLLQAELLDMLFENNELTRRILDGLQRIEELTQSRPVPVTVPAADFVRRVPEVLRSVRLAAEARRLELRLPVAAPDLTLRLDQENFWLAFEELVVNACKYAPENTPVDVFVGGGNQTFRLSVKNEVRGPGIPVGHEKLVTEPFYRLAPSTDCMRSVEKLGLGLGLAFVQLIVQAHGGTFSIREVSDHTGDRVVRCVMAEITLPAAAPALPS